MQHDTLNDPDGNIRDRRIFSKEADEKDSVSVELRWRNGRRFIVCLIICGNIKNKGGGNLHYRYEFVAALGIGGSIFCPRLRSRS